GGAACGLRAAGRAVRAAARAVRDALRRRALRRTHRPVDACADRRAAGGGGPGAGRALGAPAAPKRGAAAGDLNRRPAGRGGAIQPRRIVGAVVAAALTSGVTLAPIETLLVTAWLHNLTPLAFVAERSAPQERARRLAWLALPFLVLPAVIATGLPALALHA